MFGRLKVGPGRYFDGQENVSPRGDIYGSVVVTQFAPSLFELALRGHAFIYHVASQAILLSATTGGHPTIINPIGSGVLFVPTRLSVSWISGVHVAGACVWGETANVGNGPATASALLTATLVAPRSARRVNTGQPKTLWSPTTNTFTAAPTIFAAAGINIATEYVTTVASTAGPLGIQDTMFNVDYAGQIVIEPGNALSLCYTVTTSTSLFQITIFGVELPLVYTS